MRGLSKAHEELYKYMEHQYVNGEKFTRPELVEIYSKFAVSNKKIFDYREFTEEQVYRNASAWLDRAIPVLIRHKYLGLTFRKNEVGVVEKIT